MQMKLYEFNFYTNKIKSSRREYSENLRMFGLRELELPKYFLKLMLQK